MRRRERRYRVSSSKRILGLPFTITSVIVQSARNSERALRAAQLQVHALEPNSALAGAGR